MENKIKQLSVITLTIIGSIIQIGCGPWMYEGQYYDSDYSSSNYSNYEKEKLDPSTLDKTEETKPEELTGLCLDKRKDVLALSDAMIFDLASGGGIGNCYISDATSCEECACSAYVKVSTSTWPGHGWALNPNSEDSTGCVSQTQYPGYTPVMAGSNLAQNAVEQIRDALRNKQDVCGLCEPTRTITVEMILE